MTGVAERATTSVVTRAGGRRPPGRALVRVLTTTDHKLSGQMYLITSFAFFLIGGVMAAPAQLHRTARIRFESPAFDKHHPELALAEYPANRAPADNLLDAGDDEGRVENLEENIEQERPDTPGRGADSSE
jgi:hypothetical protein